MSVGREHSRQYNKYKSSMKDEKMIGRRDYMKQGIGEILVRLRKESGITQAALREGVCAASELAKIENNQKNPDPFLLDHLFRRLGNLRYGWSMFFPLNYIIYMNCNMRFRCRFVAGNMILQKS